MIGRLVGTFSDVRGTQRWRSYVLGLYLKEGMAATWAAVRRGNGLQVRYRCGDTRSGAVDGILTRGLGTGG